MKTRIKLPPFNLTLFTDKEIAQLGIEQVTESAIFDNNNQLHPDGLYSSRIFGMVSESRRYTTFAHIDVKLPLLHPKILDELFRIRKFYEKLISGRSYAIWDDKAKDFVASDIENGDTGYEFFVKHLPELYIKESDSLQRELRIKLIEAYKTSAFYTKILVIPAGIRDISKKDDGNYEEPEINKYYKQLIRLSNNIPEGITKRNIADYDNIRWNMQETFNAIYDYLIGITKDKHGFFLDKFTNRNIAGGTRNIIVASDMVPNNLEGQSNVDVNTTFIGMYQTMVGILDKTIYYMHNSVLRDVFESPEGRIEVFDPKDYSGKYIDISDEERDRWLTTDGHIEIIRGMWFPTNRRKFVEIDGYPLLLIYRDEQGFSIYRHAYDIPENVDKNLLKPVTYAEYFYSILYPHEDEFIAYITRYPILGLGSIYPSYIRIKPTNKFQVLKWLNPDLNENPNHPIAYFFPIVEETFFDAVNLHPSKLPGLDADHDGDKVSVNFVMEQKSIQEAKDFLNSKSNFISPYGDLLYGINSDTSEGVLHAFSIGMRD